MDHWIAFGLLALIGVNMIKEALSENEEEDQATVEADDGVAITQSCAEDNIKEILGVKTMFLLAIATSIDALAMGVTFAFLDVNIIPAICFIGTVTFSFSAVGVKIGNVFGLKYKSKAEVTGGIILILLGCKILIEHLGIINML